MDHPGSEGRRGPLLALGLYGVLALALTGPRLLTGQRQITDGWADHEIFYWNFWWLGRALAGGQDPWYTTLVFHPAGTSLGFHPTSYLNGLLSLPLQWLLGPERGVVIAYNLIALASLVLAAQVAFLLVRQVLGHGGLAAPLVAGLVYGFSAYHVWHLGRLHVGGLEWLGLFVLALLRLLRDDVRPVRDGLLLAGATVLVLYTSLTNTASAALFTLALAVGAAFTDGARLLRRRVLAAAGVCGAVTLLAAAPFLHAWLAYPRPVQGARSVEENVAYSADPAGYVLPGRNSVLYGAMASRRLPAGEGRGEEVFAGYLTLLLAGAALALAAERRKAWLWAGIGAFFLVLSLGPSLKLLGHDTGVPLPYRVLYEVLPILKVNRTPVRYAAPLMLCLAVLAALGVRALRRRLAGRWVAPALVVVALAESLFHVPVAAREPAPALYAAMAGSGGVVINVPLYHARLERRIMYHQIFHGLPVTTACIPRSSTVPHQLLEATQLRACLLEPAGCARADPAVVAREIRERGIGWVLLHTRFLTPEALAAAEGVLSRAGARERREDPSGIVAYRF